jgi:phytoene/squalene synthetase
VREDRVAGRVYLPVEDLDRFGVDDDDLLAAVASPALRRVLALEARRAGALLRSGDVLVASLTGWARLAVAGYVAGGRAALAALSAANFEVLGRSPRPARGRVVVEAARLVLRARTAA